VCVCVCFLEYILSRIVEMTIPGKGVTLLAYSVLKDPLGISCATRFDIRKFLIIPTERICFVWVSEQTRFVVQYTIKGLVFVTVMECVYCTVRPGYFKYNSGQSQSLKSVPWLRRIVAGLSPWRPGYYPR